MQVPAQAPALLFIIKLIYISEKMSIFAPKYS